MNEMRILLVDDDANIRTLFSRVIDPLSSKLVAAESMQEALAIAKAEEFDVILLDLSLLDSTQSQTLAKVPELKRLTNAPVVLVSGSLDPYLREHYADYGADAFVPKGVSFSELNQALLLAIYTAMVRHPKPKSDSFLHSVEMLERIVRAAA